MRASRYRKSSVPLANAVFGCYAITEAQAKAVGEPLADVLVEYLPDDWLQKTVKASDPINCVLALYLVVQQVMGNEKALVERYNERLIGQGPAAKDPGKATYRPTEAVGAQEAPEAQDYPETPLATAQEPSEAILAAADMSAME